MRAALVLNIIESYFKNESSFMDAVQKLVQDESKKGNDDFVNKINDILKNKKNTKKSNIKNSFLQSTGPIFNLSNVNTTLLQTPKDKDSSLSLMEIIDPSISFSDLVLSEKMKKTIDQIIEETKKSALLENAGIYPTRLWQNCYGTCSSKSFRQKSCICKIGFIIFILFGANQYKFTKNI